MHQKTRSQKYAVGQTPPVADPSSWSAQDAAGYAMQAATLAQKYYKMTTDSVSHIRGELDELALKLNHQGQKQKGVENDRAALRNTCMFWGGGSAIVASLAVSLIIGATPSPQSLKLEQTQAQHLSNQRALDTELTRQKAVQAQQQQIIQQLQSNQTAQQAQIQRQQTQIRQAKPQKGGKKGG